LIPTPPDNPPPLVDGELVDDRALDAFDGDSFGHADFARELAGVIGRTKTPANIALFGAWGSGKSGIANLVKQALPQKKSEVRFVVFDASKYAELPLRRHFISQVAHGLEINADKYHRGLYVGEETRDIKFRGRDWLRLVGAFGLSVTLTLAVLLAIATFVAAVSTGPFGSNWSHIVRDYLLATLPVAAVITTFVKLAADGFHITTHRSAPSGDEEFETRFEELVGDAKTERLVVFIDELDRCSPAQVASVLETLKTFLFIKGCVFVVAADQQVLEQALRRKVRQHTPEDATNPYYSAGSSYLDKVFQYQLTLPPLRSPTLSRFAVTLAEGRPGVWQRVPRLDEAISVLIPSHVVSPRRVKVLLNRFAIAYRLAERRAAEGRLDPDFGARATELSKLVCLQSEFPLFAEDLTIDARLPDLVRMVADNEDLPASVRPDVMERATAYAEGRRIVAELLVEVEPIESRKLIAESTQVAEGDGEGLEDEDNDELDEDPQRTSRADEVARKHAQQLVAYLRKTRHVAGPAPDLLYLESAGAGHGIDAVLADRLQRAAVDNDTAEVLALVASASRDGQGRGALLVLADVVRQAQPGIEGRNAAGQLLQAIQRSGVGLGGDADAIADAIAAHLVQAELQPEDLLGALILARACHRDVGPKLLDAVIRHPDATQSVDVACAVLDQADAVPRGLRERLASVTSTALLDAPGQVAQHLVALPSGTTRTLLSEATAVLKEASDAHYAAVKAREANEAFDEADILDPPPHATLPSVYDSVAALAGASQPIPARELEIELVRLLLALDRSEYRGAVGDRLSEIAPVDSGSGLIADVMGAVLRRALPEWPRWLDPLDSHAIAADSALHTLVDALAVKVWQILTGAEPPAPEDAQRAVEALARCAGGASSGEQLQDAVGELLDVPFASDDAVAQQADALEHARALSHTRLLAGGLLADIILGGVTQTLQAAKPPAQPAQPPSATVEAAVLARVHEEAQNASPDALQRVLAASSETAWLSDAGRSNLQLVVANALHVHDQATPAPLTIEELHTLVPLIDTETTVDETLALALEHFTETPEDAWRLVEPLADRELPPLIRAALSEFAQRLGSAERFALIEPALQRAISQPIDRSFFEAARLSEVSAQKVAESLGQLFTDAHDETGWRAVLSIWQELGPTAQAPQRRLVDEVYLPLVGKGDIGLDVALSYFKLVAGVDGVRKDVTDALREAAQTDEQKNRIDERLRDAGWRRRPLFGLMPPVDIDE
jgi:hypothetical protein